MPSGIPISLHLAVHLLGLTAAVGLAAYALGRREDAGPGWAGFAVGGGILAVAHLLSGALFTGDHVWPVYFRAAGYAGLAVGGAGSLAGPAVVAAAAPLGAYLTAGITGVAAAVASLRGVLGRRRDTLVLAAGIALWAAADVTSRFEPTVAAAVSIVGSLTVAAWLLSRARESLLWRIAASFVGALLVLVLALASFGGILVGAELKRDALETLASAAGSRAEEISDEWTAEALTIARLFATDTLAAVLATAEPERLQAITRSLAELPEVDVALLVGPRGEVLSTYEWGAEPRGPLPSADALLLAGDDLVVRALAGDDTSGLVAVGQRDIIAVAASPVFPAAEGQERRDRLSGVLVVGRRATEPVVLAEAAKASGAEVTAVVGGRLVGSTLDEGAEDVAAAIAEGRREGVVEVGGQPVFLAAEPLGEGGQAPGWIALTENAANIAGAERSSTRDLFLVAVAGLVATGLLAAWAAGRTTRPVRRLTETAERVAAGDLRVRTGIRQPDEIGRLATAFDEMTGALSAREEDLRRAAAVEAELRSRLEVLTRSMGEGLVAVDVAGRVQTVNPAAERLLGVSADRLLGRYVGDVLGVSTGGAALLETLGGPEVSTVRAAHGAVGAGRSAIPVAATAAPLRGGDGAHLGRVYVLRDISGEAEVERMKTEFLANISHELRTPLTPIKGYAEVMRQRELPSERVAAFSTEIAEATRRLERVIGMLVDFAALEAGRLEVRPESMEVRDVVDRVLEQWRARHPDRRLTRWIARDLPQVHADPRLVARVLEELIDNALKFSDGPVRVRAQLDDGARPPSVRLTVSDEGVGIPPDELAAISREFHQVDGSATRQHGGLGLGLSLVTRIAQRLDAKLVVDSREAGGTDVHLQLPVASVVRSW